MCLRWKRDSGELVCFVLDKNEQKFHLSAESFFKRLWFFESKVSPALLFLATDFQVFFFFQKSFHFPVIGDRAPRKKLLRLNSFLDRSDLFVIGLFRLFAEFFPKPVVFPEMLQFFPISIEAFHSFFWVVQGIAPLKNGKVWKAYFYVEVASLNVTCCHLFCPLSLSRSLFLSFSHLVNWQNHFLIFDRRQKMPSLSSHAFNWFSSCLLSC